MKAPCHGQVARSVNTFCSTIKHVQCFCCKLNVLVYISDILFQGRAPDVLGNGSFNANLNTANKNNNNGVMAFMVATVYDGTW